MRSSPLGYVQILRVAGNSTSCAFGQTEAILPESSKSYGAGTGYRLTLNVFLGVSIATTLMLLGIAAVSVLASRKPDNSAWRSDEVIQGAVNALTHASPQRKTWAIESLRRTPDTNEYALMFRGDNSPAEYAITLDVVSDGSRGRILNIKNLSVTIPSMSMVEAQTVLKRLGYYRGPSTPSEGRSLEVRLTSCSRAMG